MGNRAYVVFEDQEKKQFSPAIYLHWNGGPESVYAFLDALDRYQVRQDQNYEAARFVQIVGNFMGGALSLGLEATPDDEKDLERFTPGDNGLYVVCRNPAGVTTPGKKSVRRVRRMFQKWDGGKAKNYWLSPEEVEAEAVEAYGHAYHKPDKDGKTIEAVIDGHNKERFTSDK